MIVWFMFVIRGESDGSTKKPFGIAAPERPDHDIESWLPRVLALVRRNRRRKPTLMGALRPSVQRRAALGRDAAR